MLTNAMTNPAALPSDPTCPYSEGDERRRKLAVRRAALIASRAQHDGKPKANMACVLRGRCMCFIRCS